MRYLGIDWGLKKAGLSISDGLIASPYSTISILGLDDGVRKILEIVQKEGIEVLVVGKPEGEMGKLVEKLTQKLKNKGLVVQEADETLSTKEAQSLMIESGMGMKARRSDDKISAAIILQRFLDQQ